ncbi:thiol reductant ABC exporter subunit CydD [Streptomyces sp. NPDC004111]|uniref:thiol reductant ABC exporter subunit CydD n=1 Tax=Streptomyces sp. NPDC004111 TaxID=3364690 RepID=UPI003673B1B0
MKPVEGRLLSELPLLRRHLTHSTVLALLIAGLVVAQAALLAAILADGFAGHGVRLAPSVALGAVLALRALLTWVRGTLGHRAAADAKRALRDRLTDRLGREDPLPLSAGRHGETATLLTRGLDALDPYVVGRLPAKAAAGVVPVVVVAWLWWTDWTSGLIVVVTLPLIPVFGALVGLHTAERTARQWQLLARLGGHFLDVVTGLPTLRAFGRERHQVGVVREMADAHRRATMRTLRVAFLSSFVLETVATLSVALVAVPVGLRLLGGEVDLRTALTVLLLAPEAYLPLRALGAAFHESAEGLTVAERVFARTEGEEEREAGTRAGTRAESGTDAGAGGVDGADGADRRDMSGRTVSGRGGAGGAGASGRYGAATSTGHAGASRTGVIFPGVGALPALALRRVTVRYPGRAAPALRDVSLSVRPGEHLALIGPSGAGKSTLLALLLGFVVPAAGRVEVDGTGVLRPDTGIGRGPGAPLDAWRSRVAWVPQRPHLFAESVAENIRLGRPDATDAEVRAAAVAASADRFVEELPQGYDTPLGEHGAGLSAGQRQRIALARAFLKDAPVLLLDEPTAHLDPESEAAVTRATVALMRGRTSIVVAHRTSLLAHADRVVTVRDGRIATAGECSEFGNAYGPAVAVRGPQPAAPGPASHL